MDLTQSSQRLRRLATLVQQAPDLTMTDGEIALPARIVRVGLRQALSDGEAAAERFQRAFKIALCHLHVADLVGGHRQIVCR